MTAYFKSGRWQENGEGPDCEDIANFEFRTGYVLRSKRTAILYALQKTPHCLAGLAVKGSSTYQYLRVSRSKQENIKHCCPSPIPDLAQ
mgnify:CR=1 FL=1